MLNVDGKKSEPELKDFRENHTDTTVSFTLSATAEKIDSFERESKGLHGKFKLNGSLSTSNMHMFDTGGRIVKYKAPEDILKEFFLLRLEFYQKRKEMLLKKMRREQKMLMNKARFVEEVCNGDLVVSNRKRAEILQDLQGRGYDQFTKDDEEEKDLESEEPESDDEAQQSDAVIAKGYEYLLGMKIWSLTFEKAEELRKKLAEKTQEVADLEATAPSQIWTNDLNDIEDALDERDVEIAAANADELEAQSKNKKRSTKKKQSRPRATAKAKPVASVAKNGSGIAQKATLKKRQRQTTLQIATEKVSEATIPLPPKKEEATVDSDSDDDDVSSSLAARIQRKLLVSPPQKKTKKAPMGGDVSSDDSTVDMKPAQGSTTKSTAKRGRRAVPALKKRAPKYAIEESDSEDFSDSDQSTPPARQRTGGRARAKTSYKVDLSDSDSDFDFDE